jgi:hypothetical protein
VTGAGAYFGFHDFFLIFRAQVPSQQALVITSVVIISVVITYGLRSASQWTPSQQLKADT